MARPHLPLSTELSLDLVLVIMCMSTAMKSKVQGSASVLPVVAGTLPGTEVYGFRLGQELYAHSAQAGAEVTRCLRVLYKLLLPGSAQQQQGSSQQETHLERRLLHRCGNKRAAV